jgi:arginine deiminase
MVDRDAFTVCPELKEASTGYLLEPGPNGVTVQHEDELFATIARVLDLPKVRLFETGGDRYEAEREQWEDGNNVLALAPGVVVAYERNVETNTRLRHDGIQVITIEGPSSAAAGPVRVACRVRSSVTRSPTTPEVAGRPGQRRSTRGTRQRGRCSWQPPGSRAS